VAVLECNPREDHVEASSVVRSVFELRQMAPTNLVGFMTHGNMVVRLTRLAGGHGRVFNSFRAGSEKPIPRLLYRATPWLCDMDVPNSASTADWLIAQRVVRDSRVHVIANGVDSDRFAPRSESAMRKELAGNATFVWVMVARMRVGAGLEGRPSEKRFD